MNSLNIDGVVLTPLRKIKVEGGDVLQGLKSSEDCFTKFGEAYFSSIDPGAIKAWKKHTIATLNLIVPVGEVLFVLSEENGKFAKVKFQEVFLSLEKYNRLTIPPNVWFGFQGLGTESSLILSLSNIEHCSNEIVRADKNEFGYKWV